MTTTTHTCDCYCRNTIRFIRRAFTQNELNTEEIIPMTLQTAMEEIEGLATEYNTMRYRNFALCLRINLAHPASTLEALETCRCCQRHQQNRHLVTWTLFNASETLPGAPMALGNLPDYTIETDPETDYVSDSESEATDFGPDSP